MKRKVLAVALSLTMVFSAIGCGSTATTSNESQASEAKEETTAAESTEEAQEEEITCTLTVWSPSEDQNPEYGEWLVTMCNQFNELHPNWNITFEYGVCSESDAKGMVTQDVEAAADVFIYSSTGLETLASANALAEFGGSYLDEINENYSKVMVDCLTYDGGVYGVPMTTNTFFMYYDTSVFSEEDITSLEAMLEKGTVAISLAEGFYLSAFYLGAGATFFGEDGTDRDAGMVIYSDDTLAMTDYLIDLVKNENLVIATPDAALSMMREGTVDAYWCGTWQAAQTEELLGENFGVAPLPSATVNGEEVQLRPFNSAKAIGVNSTTEYPQVAIALAVYLGGYDSQLLHYQTRGYVPCYLSLLENEEIQQDAVVAVDAYTIANIAVARSTFAEMTYFWTPAESFGMALRDGELTHENAAEMLQALEDASNSSGLD